MMYPKNFREEHYNRERRISARNERYKMATAINYENTEYKSMTGLFEKFREDKIWYFENYTEYITEEIFNEQMYWQS